MAESSSQNPSSLEITPKEELVTLDKPESPNPFLPAIQVEFTFEEIAFTTNNEVALLYSSHPNQEYFKDVDYAKLIWEDLIHKLNKKTREKIVPYPSHQPKEPPFTDHMKSICNQDVLVESKAPKPSSQTEEVPQGSNPIVLVDKTKSVGDGLKTAHTDSGVNEESRADDMSLKVKLEDLS
ncbi:hypothetical protein Tco_0672351 [Tanacetum coccineum]